MIIGMSHEDLKKLRAGRKKKGEIRPRKRRTTVLSRKTKEKALEQFEKEMAYRIANGAVNANPLVDKEGMINLVS